MTFVSRTFRQQILRKVRERILKKASLNRFKLVNDDELGQTYVAGAVRGPGYAIVEIGVEDGEFVHESPSGVTVRYTVITRGID